MVSRSAAGAPLGGRGPDTAAGTMADGAEPPFREKTADFCLLRPPRGSPGSACGLNLSPAMVKTYTKQRHDIISESFYRALRGAAPVTLPITGGACMA